MPYTNCFLLSRIEHILLNRQLRYNFTPGDNIEVYFANRRYSLPPNPLNW
jgi:hypothetical protein